MQTFCLRNSEVEIGFSKPVLGWRLLNHIHPLSLFCVFRVDDFFYLPGVKFISNRRLHSVARVASVSARAPAKYKYNQSVSKHPLWKILNAKMNHRPLKPTPPVFCNHDDFHKLVPVYPWIVRSIVRAMPGQCVFIYTVGHWSCHALNNGITHT